MKTERKSHDRMKMLSVCCLTKFSFKYKEDVLWSDGFLGRSEWGLFGIPWEGMSKLVVVGFKAFPEQVLRYKHAFPSKTEVVILGPEKGRSGNVILRGIKELFGIMGRIIKQRARLKDLDIIFSEFREYTFFEIMLIKLFAWKAKTIVYFISDFPESNYSRHHNRIFKWLLILLIDLCQLMSDDVWFISEHLLRKYRLRSTKRFGVVRPSNIESCEIKTDSRPHRIMRDSMNLICVARIEKEKRLDIILKTVKILIDEGLPVHLRIVGDGALLNELKYTAEALGIDDNVDFAGYITEREKLLTEYRNADLSLLASEHEGLGLVLVESLSQGTPAITNHFEGAEEIIHDGVEGYLIDARDPDALAAGMAEKIKYIYKNPEVYQKLSHNGPIRSKMFTLEAVTAIQRMRIEELLD